MINLRLPAGRVKVLAAKTRIQATKPPEEWDRLRAVPLSLDGLSWERGTARGLKMGGRKH